MKFKKIVYLCSIGLVVFLMVGCGDVIKTGTIITTIPESDPVSISWCPDLEQSQM